MYGMQSGILVLSKLVNHNARLTTPFFTRLLKAQILGLRKKSQIHETTVAQANLLSQKYLYTKSLNWLPGRHLTNKACAIL